MHLFLCVYVRLITATSSLSGIEFEVEKLFGFLLKGNSLSLKFLSMCVAFHELFF